MKIMNAPELRKNLHNQIEHLDEKTLEAVYSMFQDYFGGDKDFELTKAHKDLIDERLEDYEKNPQNVISWEESNRLLKKYL
jgi:hypothetical protein